MRNWLPLTVGLAIAAAPAAAQTQPMRIALSGAAAPSGGSYGNFGGPAVLNRSGQVAFVVGLTGGTSPVGIFLASSTGVIQTVALEGTDYPAGGVVSNLTLNAAGKAAFLSTPFAGSQGVYAGVPGSVAALAVSNTPSPAGGVYNELAGPVLNDPGQVAFHSTVFGGSSNSGIFLAAPSGSVQGVALQGLPAAGLPGNNYVSFDTRPALNGSGQVAFLANLSSGSVTRGIFVGAPASLQSVVQGSAAPGGGAFSAFQSPTLNGPGQVAFIASLTGGPSSLGIFAGAPGSLQSVARTSSAAPGGGGNDYTNFAVNPVLNSTGQVAFSATLFNNPSNTFSSGIFAGAPGSVQAVAIQGAAAPAGGNYGSLLNVLPVLNDAGQVAFVANLTGGGITPANDTGLFAGSPGSLVEVVREGTLVNVDPGAGVDNRTVAANGIGFLAASSGGYDGRGMSFTNGGLIVYRLSFTDGSSGVFSSVVPVPEPVSVLLCCAVGGGAWAGVRRWRIRPAPDGGV